MSRRIEVNVLESNARADAKLFRVLAEIILQLLIRGLNLADEFFGDEIELLADATANHRVVAVQPDRRPLAISRFFANEVVNQAIELGPRGRSLPRTRK